MQSKNIALYLLSLSIFSLAGALTYFAASLFAVNSNLPQIISSVEKINQNVEPLIAEAADIKKQIPAILKESENIRNSIEVTLKEVEKFNAQIPTALSESSDWRKLVPGVVNQVELSRETVDAGIKELSSIRNEISPTLTRVESIVTESRKIGKTTSEGAVSGVLIGALRAPFELIAGLGNSVFSIFSNEEIQLEDSDKQIILDTVQGLINTTNFRKNIEWKNPDTDRSGSVTLLSSTTRKNLRCFDVLFTFNSQKTAPKDVTTELCESEPGRLELAN